MLVALGVGQQARLGRIDAGPAEGRLGEQDVGSLALETVLEQSVREDHIDSGRLAAVADHLAQEPAVVGDDLEVEQPHAAARRAAAPLVGLELALPGLEGGERLIEHVEQVRGRGQGAVG
ncbi:MAG TPA: hypothetical protein VFX28_12065, partial [Methylomirabilota bacterium]|nr:hypothetical protein [Methylomirabilota bacterium]